MHRAFGYDYTGQLTGVTYSNWTHSPNSIDDNFTYDANGNRITGGYGVGDDNQMTAGAGYMSKSSRTCAVGHIAVSASISRCFCRLAWSKTGGRPRFGIGKLLDWQRELRAGPGVPGDYSR